jgi:hypothetical protein
MTTVDKAVGCGRMAAMEPDKYEEYMFQAIYLDRMRKLHHVTRRVLGYLEDMEIYELQNSPSPTYGVTPQLRKMMSTLKVSSVEIEFALAELRASGLITESGGKKQNLSVSPAEARKFLRSTVKELVEAQTVSRPNASA